MRLLLGSVLVLAVLAGCQREQKPEDRLFDGDRKALEKAQGVQQTVDQQAASMQQGIASAQ